MLQAGASASCLLAFDMFVSSGRWSLSAAAKPLSLCRLSHCMYTCNSQTSACQEQLHTASREDPSLSAAASASLSCMRRSLRNHTTAATLTSWCLRCVYMQSALPLAPYSDTLTPYCAAQQFTICSRG